MRGRLACLQNSTSPEPALLARFRRVSEREGGILHQRMAATTTVPWHSACGCSLPMNSQLQTQSIECDQISTYSGCRQTKRARGIVQSVDLVGRDMTVLLQTGVEVFDIPPDCAILLHGEQVKLRMVQPRDHVWITFTRASERLVAEKLEVQSDTGFSCFRL